MNVQETAVNEVGIAGLKALSAIEDEVGTLGKQVERNFIDTVTGQILSNEAMQERRKLLLQRVCKLEGCIMEEAYHLEMDRLQATM